MKKISPQASKLLKNILGFCIFFTIIASTIEKTIAYFVSNSEDSQTGKVNLIMNHKIDPELIIFGSSVVEVGFNSQIMSNKLNRNVYNMGIDGTPIAMSEFLIDEFLSYSKKCDTVIIGLSVFSFAEIEKMNEPSRYLAHKANIYLKEKIKEVSPNLYSKLYNIPYYSFIVADHTYYKNAFMGFKNILKGEAIPSNVQKGFVSHDKQYFNTHKAGDITLSKTPFISSKKTISNYIKIIKTIKSNGITPILVISPMHMNGQNSFKNYSKYINTVKNIAYKTKTSMIDFSKHDIVNHEKYFYNNGHLNTLGALEFSSSICDSLTLNKNLITN
jgi:hypothetical protein